MSLSKLIFRSAVTQLVVGYMALTGFFFAVTAGLLLRDERESIKFEAESVGEVIDSRVLSMDALALQVAYYELLQQAFSRYATGDESGLFERRRALLDLLVGLIGPVLPTRQINLYDFSGRRIGVGMRLRIDSVSPGTDRLRRAVDADGARVLFVGRESLGPDEAAVSVLRLFYDRAGTPAGVVEVVQRQRDVFSFPRLGVASRSGRLAVVDENRDAIAVLKEHADFRSDDSDLRAEHVSPVTGWTTQVTVPRSEIMAPVYRFAGTTVLVLLPLIAGSAVAAYAITKRITVPLAKIHTDIRAVESEFLKRPIEPMGKGANELVELDAAVIALQSKLRETVEEVVESRTAESQARLRALRFQIQPHFFYNVMNTISSMAYEGMTVEISALAESFSEVMRYVLTEGEDVVTVKAEMDFVTNYLRCIKYRFEDDFHYTVEVSDAALDARLPRLITQPVVENAVKYVTSVETPWHVSVSAHLDAGCTTVEVSDNGPGMGGPEQRHPDGLGIGLRSVKERLDGFGNGRSTMTVEGNIPRGTSVRLWITAQ